ncbi:trypsin-like peptidase domain-containing protein, partial [Kitasatospora sp. NPDC058063]
MAQVVDGAGVVVGAGFLVAEDLVFSCAHVLADGGYGPGDVVRLLFPHAPGAPAVEGRVEEEGWRDPQGQDIALVRLEAATGVAPLRLGSAVASRGHRVRSFGFPSQAPPSGHFGFATAGGLLPPSDGVGDLLQLTGANDLTTGFSGGPVLDEVTGLVVGMLTAIAAPDSYDRGLGIAYATPSAVLREVWPALGEHDVSPYRALEPFTAEHARWFRGRQEAVRQVLAGLAGRPRVVLLLGPSGSGKSSLVQAGVLPALAEGRLPGSDRWHQVVVRPGPDLSSTLEHADLPRAATSGIAEAVTELLAAEPAHDRVVLVVDQFEELLASAVEPRAHRALELITEAISSDAALSVVLVMRDDFYPRLSALAPGLLAAALQARGVLNVPTALTDLELDEIISGPAHDLDADLEPELAERIVADVLALNPDTTATSEAPVTVLPLLEVTLTRLWERRLEHDGRLTHDAYRRIGAVTGALADWCDTALGELDPHQRDIARRILTALVRPADESLYIPAVRQQLPLDDLRDLAAADRSPEALQAVDEVLAVLTRHRIVTTDRIRLPGQLDDGQGTAVAELIHDALIRDWDTLRTWVEQDARFHDWLHRARLQHTRWQQQRDPQDLPSGSVLAEGQEWSRSRLLPGDIEAFLDAGHHRQQAAARRNRRVIAVLATILVLALIAAGVAFWQRQTAITARQEAVAQRLTAQSRQLAAQSDSLLGTNSDLAALLASTAYRTSPTTEAAAALTAAANRPLLRRFAIGPSSEVAFSPDVRTLAATGPNLKLQVWDVATGETVPAFTNQEISTRLVKFSPDGRTLATATDNGKVQVWDVATGKVVSTFIDPNPSAPLSSPVFSPDGRILATSNKLGEVRLWDIATGTAITTITTRAKLDVAVVFSPDGRTLAITEGSDLVRLWDVATGKVVSTFIDPSPSARLFSPVFSPDGRILATSNKLGEVRVWDLATGRTVA